MCINCKCIFYVIKFIPIFIHCYVLNMIDYMYLYRNLSQFYYLII